VTTPHYLQQVGWDVSRENRLSVDAHNNPVPWITYPAFEFLRRNMDKIHSVFEYGAGYSTLWWANAGKFVRFVEHDERWFCDIVRQCPANASGAVLPLGPDYVNFPNTLDHKFDLVVIDGRLRVECAQVCLGLLTEHGVVLWDNTERPNYAAGMEFLAQQGLRRVDFWGMGPINSQAWCTSLLYGEYNLFGL